MKNKIGKVLIGIGILLVLSAVFMLARNRYEDNRAGESAAQAMDMIRGYMAGTVAEDTPQTGTTITPGPTAPITPTPTVRPDAPTKAPDINRPMKEVVLNGNSYIGYLSIPDKGMELPVLSGWDYAKLKIAPCRYSGTTFADNLVIAGHNYRKHFNPLQDIELGTEIFFTDMDGAVIRYVVADVEVLKPSAIEEMIESEWDLTLFTCTYGGKTRMTIRCRRKP